MHLRSDLPVELVQSVGDDDMIAAAARVSTGHDLDNRQDPAGLYRVLEGDFYLPGGARPLEQVGKPGHYEFAPGSQAQLDLTREALEAAYAAAWVSYEFILKQGVAKEVARDCLPVGLYTSFYATCNPRSLMHFLGLRTHGSGSQPLWEIEQVALGMEARFKELYPATHEAFQKNGRVAP